MKISKEFLLALIIIFIATFVVIGFSQENNKEGTPQEKTTVDQQEPGEKDMKPQEDKKPEEKIGTPWKEGQEKYNEAELLRESQSNLNRSLNTLNTVATLMGVLVGLITVIIIIAIALGLFEYRRYRAIMRRARRSAEIIDDIQKKGEEVLAKARKAFKEVSSISLVEEPSSELKEKLDEYSRRLEFVEIFGLPLKAEDYINRGYDLRNKDRYEHALEAFDKAINLEPENYRAWLGKGIVFDRLGKNEEALKISDKLIALKPEEPVGWNNKGASLIKLGRYEEALVPIEKAMNIFPYYASAWGFKSRALFGLKRYRESLEALEKAIELNPANPKLWNFKNFILVALDNFDEALKASEKAIELKPEYASSWYNRAFVYSFKKDKENSLLNLSKAIELDPKLKEEAKKDEDFKWLWEDAEFKKITS